MRPYACRRIQGRVGCLVGAARARTVPHAETDAVLDCAVSSDAQSERDARHVSRTTRGLTECAQLAQLKTAAAETIRENARPLTLWNIDSCRFAGLYAIWYKHRCLYVGQSERQTVYARLYAHLSRCHNEALRLWIRVKDGTLRFTACRIDNATVGTIRSVESHLIRHLDPETNEIRPRGKDN